MGVEIKCLGIIKVTYNKPTANTTFNAKSWKQPFLGQEQDKDSCSHHSGFSTVLGVPATVTYTLTTTFLKKGK